MISGLLVSVLMLWLLPSTAIVFPADHVGLTVQKSPVLYFYLPHFIAFPIHFTLVDDRRISPVAEFILSSPAGPGFVPIRLGHYQIVLEEEVQYRWYVSVVQGAEPSRTDIVAGGIIERIDPRLVDYYGYSCDRDSALLAAKAGLWIDAFSCAIELIEANPEDQSLRRLRDNLLGIFTHYRKQDPE
jgi:hypothetical protein